MSNLEPIYPVHLSPTSIIHHKMRLGVCQKSDSPPLWSQLVPSGFVCSFLSSLLTIDLKDFCYIQLHELPGAVETNDHTQLLGATEACPRSVLETRRLRSGCPSTALPPEAPPGSFLPFPVLGVQASPEPTVFQCVQSGL